MKINRAGTVVLTGVIAVLLMAGAFAQGGDTSSGRGKWKEEQRDKHPGKIMEQLNLTPEQKERMEKNRKSHREAAQALRSEIQAKRKDLASALQNPQMDTKDVNRIHNELKTLMNKAEDQRLASILEIRQILTPEQFADFNSKMKALRDEHGGKRGEKRMKGEQK